MTATLNDMAVPGRVLVVDDELKNRELLRDLLEAQGHAVYEADNGPQALALAEQVVPHVILLDIMMPGMDGFEVCRQLKAHPVLSSVPVLMVTALDERADRLRGIEVGANDFLNKPIDTRDITLRVRNAVYAKQLYDRVHESYRRLQDLERLRDDLVHMIVHDMRSPLMGITGNLELLEGSVGASLKEEDRESLKDALFSAQRLVEMISSMLDVSRMEAGRLTLNRETCDLGQVVTDAVHSLSGLFKRSPVVLDLPPGGCEVVCDREIVRRVLANLLANAAKFSPDGGEIKLAVRRLAGMVKVTVSDRGPGIPLEYQARIFEKFAQLESRAQRKGSSSGLGLTFCKLAVEQLGGQIGVESSPGQGSTFWFTLPCGS